MATYGGHKHLPDSDHCHPCFVIDGNKIDSSYRCEECQHRLCDECFKNHRRNLATRDHTVIALQHLAASQFKVSGRRANNKDKTGTKSKVKASDTKSPETKSKDSTHKISDRGEQYDISVKQNTANSQSHASSSQNQSETPHYEVSGRRLKYEVSGRRVTGSDSVDQDQTVMTRLKSMRLDAGTSNTQTTRQTGNAYIRVTLKHSLNVKKENDKYDCWITGLVVLQDKLIVCDCGNNKLKVYDSSHASYRFLYEYKCDDEPRDIDMLDVNTVVVSSTRGRNMRLLSVGNDSMKEISKINTEYRCGGVCCYEGNIYCVVGGREVRVYTPDGELEHTFSRLSDGKVECNDLWYITVNPQTGTLYVTDSDKGVLALSTSGDVIAVMSPPQLKWPRGIAVDHNGHIYVCGFGSNNVIQISPDGGNIVEILSGEDKCKMPGCVKICGNKMFVSHEDPKSGDYKISVYQLS